MKAVVKLSTYTHLDEKFFEECKVNLLLLQDTIKEFKQKSLSDMSLDDLSTYRKEHSAMINHFINYYAPITAYKENFEFLQAERKQLKSEIMRLIVKEGNSEASAERQVPSDPRYIAGIKDLQAIKVFFIHVEQTYEYHKNTLDRELFQNISLKSKERERDER